MAETGQGRRAGMPVGADGPAGKSMPAGGGLSAKRRGDFLDALAETCCVQAAVARAGVTGAAVYALRRRDAAFAAAWVEALTIGYDVVEGRLLDYVLAQGDGDVPAQGQRGSASAQAPAWVQVAMLLLNRHRAAVAEGGKPLRAGRRATAAETDAVLTRRLDQLARSIKGSA